jgi:hypothetical protein
MPTLISRCPTCRRRLKRSNEANRRYWALLHAMAEKEIRGKLYSADNWHLFCVSKWLGMTDHKLPNGSTLLIPQKTSELTVSEFNDYMTQVEAWANQHLGVFLEDRAEVEG